MPAFELPAAHVGDDDSLETTTARIGLMREENFAEKLAAQKARSRLKDMRATSRVGPQDPWAKSEGGPLREIILTAHHQWFEGANTAEEAKKMAEGRARDLARAGKAGSMDGEGNRRPQELNAREAAFEEFAVAWLKDRFGDAVIQARSDRDELGYHIHAIVFVTEEMQSARSGKQVKLQPSAHPLIRRFELLQDDVGKAFAGIGLRRGERKARARREMKKRGADVPPKAQHVHPREHQEVEDLRLRQESDRLDAEKAALKRKAGAVETRESELGNRETTAAERTAEADAILAVAEGVENGEIDVSPEHEGRPFYLDPKGKLLPRIRKAPKAANRARGIFTRAFAALTARAETEADDRWAESFAALDKVGASYRSLRKRLGNDLEADENALARHLVALRRLGRKARSGRAEKLAKDVFRAARDEPRSGPGGLFPADGLAGTGLSRPV